MTKKEKFYRIVFESDTRAGKRFDVVLLWCILTSIIVAMLDSIPGISPELNLALYILEWLFTIAFSFEYILRIYISRKPTQYIFSFWGAVDLLAILPTYLSLFFFGYQYLLIVRIIRLLRVFRVLRMVRFYTESMALMRALKASFFRISIFLSAVAVIVVILGSIMYVVEGGENGFTSIPQSVYWAIITITTVGYGDIVPVTVLGKMISSLTMILGYSIIAVPTGIITVEMSKNIRQNKICQDCGTTCTEKSNYCNHCGRKLKND